MSDLFAGILIIGGSLAVALGGMYLVRRTVPREVLIENHEIAGYMLAIVGTLYGMLLGLIVVNVQTKYETAASTAQVEANCLSDIAHLSFSFSPESKEKVRDCLWNYARIARDQDWTAVSEGRMPEETIPYYRKLWRTVNEMDVQTNKQQSAYSNLLTSMSQLSDARRFRMIAGMGLSPVLWSVLIIGELLIVWFTYFFFVQRAAVQLVMTSFVVVFLSLNVFLVYLFNNPYRKILSGTNSSAGVRFRPEWFDKEDSAKPAAK